MSVPEAKAVEAACLLSALTSSLLNDKWWKVSPAASIVRVVDLLGLRDEVLAMLRRGPR